MRNVRSDAIRENFARSAAVGRSVSAGDHKRGREMNLNAILASIVPIADARIRYSVSVEGIRVFSFSGRKNLNQTKVFDLISPKPMTLSRGLYEIKITFYLEPGTKIPGGNKNIAIFLKAKGNPLSIHNLFLQRPKVPAP